MPDKILDLDAGARRVTEIASSSRQGGDAEKEVVAVAKDWLASPVGRQEPLRVKEALEKLAETLFLKAAGAREGESHRHAVILERASDQAQAEVWRINRTS